MVVGVFKRRKNVYWASVSVAHRLLAFSDPYISLAMVEMTVLITALYRKFETSLSDDMKDSTPGITSRFEVFYDVTLPRIKVCISHQKKCRKF